MDIGLDTQEDADQLVQILTAIGSMAGLCDKLPDDPALLDQPTSDLKRLIDALPEPQVDPRLTIIQGLGLARGTLGLVRDIFTRQHCCDRPLRSSSPASISTARRRPGALHARAGRRDRTHR